MTAEGVLPAEPDFDQLYRDHVDDARKLATILVGAEQAEELVAESFARVLAQLRAGRGPRDNFRAYLHVTIRNGFRDSLRGPREAPVSDQPWLLDDAQPSAEELVEDLEDNTASLAFATLPETWQKVLWHVEVEGRKPGEVADLLGMRAGAVSSLAHRAREGLRRASLDQHVVATTALADCSWTRQRLSQDVRGDLGSRAEEKVADHIGSCEECLAAYLQVERVNRKLAAWIFPVVLLGALPASGKGLAWLVGLSGVAGVGTAGASPGGAGGAGGSSGTSGTAAVAAAAAVAVGVAGLATWVVRAQHTEPTSADTRTSQEPTADDPVEAAPPADPPPDPVVRRPQVEPVAEKVPVVPVEPTTAPARRPRPQAPKPVVVEAVAPRARAVAGCGTWGSLDLPSTRGVSYARTAGDGRAGTWTVEATARSGYVLRSGSRRTFTGDLGGFVPCATLTSVTSTAHPHPVWGHWDLVVDAEAQPGADRRLSATFAFDQDVIVGKRDIDGVGWTCHTADGTPVGLKLEIVLGPGASGPLVCDYDYTGTEPPQLTVHAVGIDEGFQKVAPTGTLTLRSDDEVVGSRRFG